ncbi:universal stress protein [Dactylosporangium sp. CS-047395]|uniref:universal stress protein n=1 Tax=Dactylosporangium sp. CS-047395 TaxID=3239936 RepID=UPI003D8AD078
MTYRYGPVVVGVDGSAHSMGALRWAADEAGRSGRTLLVVAVDPRDAGLAEQAAEEARRWRCGIAAEARTHHGAPVDVLRDLARDARLIVVGGRGTEPGEEQPMGPVSQALADEAEAPVLIVHAADRWAAPDATLPLSAPVVTGFDDSEASRRALRLAFEEAAARGVPLVIIQAWTHPDLWRPGADRGADLHAEQLAVQAALDEAAARWKAEYPAVEVDVRSEPGDAVEALAVASQWAGLLVVGTGCANGESVVDGVLRYAACPVLVAHTSPHVTSSLGT